MCICFRGKTSDASLARSSLFKNRLNAYYLAYTALVGKARYRRVGLAGCTKAVNITCGPDEVEALSVYLKVTLHEGIGAKSPKEMREYWGPSLSSYFISFTVGIPRVVTLGVRAINA